MHALLLVSHSYVGKWRPTTDKDPTANTAETPILRFVAICKRQTDPIGSARIAKSDKIFMQLPEIKRALELTHRPGKKGFHSFSRGVHPNIVTIATAVLKRTLARMMNCVR